MGPEDDLLDRLERWLVAQPEWPALFGADRQTRRRTSETVARRLTYSAFYIRVGDFPSKAFLMLIIMFIFLS